MMHNSMYDNQIVKLIYELWFESIHGYSNNNTLTSSLLQFDIVFTEKDWLYTSDELFWNDKTTGIICRTFRG